MLRARHQPSATAPTAVKGTELVEHGSTLINRLLGLWGSGPDGVARQSGALGYLKQRQLIAEIHLPNFAIISMLITLYPPAQKMSRCSGTSRSVFGQRQHNWRQPHQFIEG